MSEHVCTPSFSTSTPTVLIPSINCACSYCLAVRGWGHNSEAVCFGLIAKPPSHRAQHIRLAFSTRTSEDNNVCIVHKNKHSQSRSAVRGSLVIESLSCFFWCCAFSVHHTSRSSLLCFWSIPNSFAAL